MKYLSLLLLPLSLLCTYAFSLELNPENLEFGKLRFSKPYSELSGKDDVFSEGIVLNEGDVMEILNYISNRSTLRQYNGYHYSDGGFITVYTYDSDDSGYERAVFHSGSDVSTIREDVVNGRFIVGPTTVYVGTQYSGASDWFNGISGSLNIVLHYAIQRKSSLSYKNINMISVPENAVGDGLELLVEASSDLQTWTPVHSSTVSGDKAFFRTRVVTNGE